GLRACGWNDVWSGPAKEGAAGDIGIRWRVEGTEGLARGAIGWPGWPARSPSTLDYSTMREPGTWIGPRWDAAWFPDAFAGTMAQLLRAVEDDAEPEIGGRDNLQTLALCEAVLTGAREHRVATVQEFL
ncbi:MAG: gfo/Idh/MocA family oxidoreductase, partial [Gemmataceae bacterium]|nr:gfo/Idh/MocA family oxidoreductase [Gemmataceae bacterium]